MKNFEINALVYIYCIAQVIVWNWPSFRASFQWFKYIIQGHCRVIFNLSINARSLLLKQQMDTQLVHLASRCLIDLNNIQGDVIWLYLAHSVFIYYTDLKYTFIDSSLTCLVKFTHWLSISVVGLFNSEKHIYMQSYLNKPKNWDTKQSMLHSCTNKYVCFIEFILLLQTM